MTPISTFSLNDMTQMGEPTEVDEALYELIAAEREAQAHLDAANMGMGMPAEGDVPMDLGMVGPGPGPIAPGPQGPSLEPPIGPPMPDEMPMGTPEAEARSPEEAQTMALLEQELYSQGARDAFQGRNEQVNRQNRLAHMRGFME